MFRLGRPREREIDTREHVCAACFYKMVPEANRAGGKKGGSEIDEQDPRARFSHVEAARSKPPRYDRYRR